MRYLIAMTTLLTVLTAASIEAHAQSGRNGTYCLRQDHVDAITNCSFQTMAACEKAKTGNTDTCIQNPATTGSRGGGDERGMKK